MLLGLLAQMSDEYGSDPSAGIGAIFGLFFVVFFGLMMLTLVLWVVALVDVAKRPDWHFKSIGTEKVTWILVIALTGQIGALIWAFHLRGRLKAVPAQQPTPAGWYPDGQGQPRYWDGQRWL